MLVATWNRQFLKFALAGLAATLTTYAVLMVLVEFYALGAVFVSIMGYLAGAGVNYILNYRFTFGSTQLHQVAIPRFIAVMAVGAVLNALIMHLAINWLSVHYLLAQLIAVAVVLAWSFTLNRLWAFAQ